jgi:hypothetical protein
MPGEALLHRLHQRRQRRLHARRRRSPSARLHGGCRRAAPRTAPSSSHSIIGPGHHREAGHEMHRHRGRPLNPGILLYGLGMMRRAFREHAHVQAVQVVGPVGLEGHALLAGHVLHAFEDQGARASGCSTSGRPSAAAAHWRVWSSGVAPMPPQLNTTSPLAKAWLQRCGDARPVVAHVARPRPAAGRGRPAARSPWAGACPGAGPTGSRRR